MADVQFFGIGATGFPDPDTQLVPNKASGAEVSENGLVATAPAAGLATTSELLVASSVPAAEFTTTEFFTDPQPIPESLNPNESDIILFVVSTEGDRAVNVLVVPAPASQADGTVFQESPQPRDIELWAGQEILGNLIGKIAQFLNPTGSTGTVPIQGVTAQIASIGGPTGGSPGDALSAISFVDAVSPVPTFGDRFVIPNDDRVLRRTPVIEVILSK